MTRPQRIVCTLTTYAVCTWVAVDSIRTIRILLRRKGWL